MYQPAFTETFLAMILVLVWARWLDDRGPKWVRWVPWVAGVAVVASQATAVNVLLMNGDTSSGALQAGRWIGMGTCLLALAVLGGTTAVTFARGPKA